MKKQSKKKTMAAIMFGTALEYYDMSLYSLMTPLLISLFLPYTDKLSALILTFVMTPFNIIVRPLGALLIGHIGDLYGRKKALLFSIAGMAFTTGLIGLLPTYSNIGIAAPISFLLLRSLQGFFLAGEYNGSAILALEHKEKKSHGYTSAILSMNTVLGILCATVAATCVSSNPEKYWRIPYIFGAFAGCACLYLRSFIVESPEFIRQKTAKKKKEHEKSPVNFQRLFAAMSMSALLGILSTVPTILMISLLPIATKISIKDIMTINTVTTIISVALYPFFGKLSDKITVKKSMFWSILLIFISSYPLIAMIKNGNIVNVIIMKLCFAVLMAWFIAPFHAWMQNIFQIQERYKGISLCYSIGYQIGALTVPLSLWFWQKFQSFTIIYVSFFIISLASLWANHVMKQK